MNRIQKLAVAVAAIGFSVAPQFAKAQAATQFIGVGSSALWQTAGIASWELAGKLHHYTFKLTGNGGVQDTRNTNIAPAQGSLFIVWDNSTAPTMVYAGVSLDSTVGNRLFLGTNSANQPAGKLVLPTPTIPAAANLISVTWGADDTTLPAAVVSALNAAPIVTAAFTDIRPEDAAFATARAEASLGVSVSDGAHSYAGLGYQGALSPTVTNTNYIESSFSSAAFQVVSFNTHGTDPLSGGKIPAFTSYRVGVSPVILIDNRTNAAGLGATNAGGSFYFTNLSSAEARSLWTGTTCSSSVFAVAGAPSVPLTVNEREPLSGTYNTFEYQVINTPYTATLANQTSQENGVNPVSSTGNPLNQNCSAGGGSRRRAIGTGEMVNTDILNVADSIGYAFFTFGNISKIAGSAKYGYLTLNGVDPINATYTNGQLPTSGTLSSLFTHVNDGTYASWSDLRIVSNGVGNNATNASTLATRIQTDITNGTQLPDFIPFSSAKVYRSHYSNGTYTNGAASNGLAGGTENGGDVNGAIETGNVAPGTLNVRN